MLLMLKVATFTKSLSVPVLPGCPAKEQTSSLFGLALFYWRKEMANHLVYISHPDAVAWMIETAPCRRVSSGTPRNEGAITSTSTTSRQDQFGLKLVWSPVAECFKRSTHRDHVSSVKNARN